jgi:PhzF family phenazine biosynthesis protein
MQGSPLNPLRCICSGRTNIEQTGYDLYIYITSISNLKFPHYFAIRKFFKMVLDIAKGKIQTYILPFTTLDVFTTTPYEGNPLAVIKIPASLRSVITQEKKQAIAREFNLSESIFIHESLNPSAEVQEWDVDIFTTDDELPFAGHPTIGAAAYVLCLSAKGGRRSGRFITKAGPVPIFLKGDGSEGGVLPVVSVDIPHNVHIHAHTIGDLERPILGLSAIPEIRKAELRAPIVSIVKGMTFLLVELKSLTTLGEVTMENPGVDFHGLLDGDWGEGFVSKYYFVVLGEERGVVRVRTRMIEVEMEDPATGSAASALSVWLSLMGDQRGRSGGIRRFEVTQGVEMGRRSVIGVEVVLGEKNMERRVEGVRLSGSAVLVMEGSLRI